MPDPHSTNQFGFYGVPLAVWLTLLASVAAAVLSAATTIFVMWRSNVNSRKNLRE
jgi:hypothetical protein